jgi:hypothetical protein
LQWNLAKDYLGSTELDGTKFRHFVIRKLEQRKYRRQLRIVRRADSHVLSPIIFAIPGVSIPVTHCHNVRVQILLIPPTFCIRSAFQMCKNPSNRLK